MELFAIFFLALALFALFSLAFGADSRPSEHEYQHNW
jgi:hypothetical protein